MLPGADSGTGELCFQEHRPSGLNILPANRQGMLSHAVSTYVLQVRRYG